MVLRKNGFPIKSNNKEGVMCICSFIRKRRKNIFLTKSVIFEAERESLVSLVKKIILSLKERGILAKNCNLKFLILRRYKEQYGTRDLGLCLFRGKTEIAHFVLMRCCVNENILINEINSKIKAC